MPKKLIQRGIILATVLVVISLFFLTAQAAAKTITVLDGQVSVTDSIGNGSLSGGTVTIQAKGSLLGICCCRVLMGHPYMIISWLEGISQQQL